MAVAATLVPQFLDQATSGQYLRYARIDVTGLTAGNNTVPHGLKDSYGNGLKPLQISLEPTSNGMFWEYQAADAANIYVGVGSGGGTTCSIYVTY